VLSDVRATAAGEQQDDPEQEEEATHDTSVTEWLVF
jgi:hypothetical protein